jgi:hypothetical protein
VKISHPAEKQPVQLGHHGIIIDNQHINHAGFLRREAGALPAICVWDGDQNGDRLYAV